MHLTKNPDQYSPFNKVHGATSSGNNYLVPHMYRVNRVNTDSNDPKYHSSLYYKLPLPLKLPIDLKFLTLKQFKNTIRHLEMSAYFIGCFLPEQSWCVGLF